MHFFTEKLPLFANLVELELRELAEEAHEVVCSPQSILVKESEIIDSVFVIMEGSAEVSREPDAASNKPTEILEVLHPGEAIGLNNAGFFSTTSVRSATVTALTPVLAIRLELANLKRFFLAHRDAFSTQSEALMSLL
jgi:CRP-like cAMP-binding protein